MLVQKAGSPGSEKSDLLCLYNLESDPFEKTNVADEYPDILEDLSNLLTGWEGQLSDPKWPPVMHFYMNVWGTRYWFAI